MSILTNTSGYFNDTYDGQRYYAEQERRYREHMEFERGRMYGTIGPYNANTDTYGGVSAQQMQEEKPVKNPVPAYLTEKKLLLLGN